MGEVCRADSLPGKAELPVPGGRLRQVKVRYGRGPVKVAKGTKIVLPADAWAAFRDLRDEPVEVFRVAFLDWGNHLMAYEDVARGTVSRVHIHPREVFFSAVHLRASSIITSITMWDSAIRSPRRMIGRSLGGFRRQGGSWGSNCWTTSSWGWRSTTRSRTTCGCDGFRAKTQGAQRRKEERKEESTED